MPDPTADPLVYLLGSSSAYHRTAGAAGSAISRNRFRHHTFQLVVSSLAADEETPGAHDNPGLELQVCLADTDLVSDPAEESWSKLGVLTAAAPILQLGYAVLRNVRAKRTGASVWGIKVLMASANDRPDE